MELKKGETIMTDASLHLPAAFLHEAFSNRSGVPPDHFELYYRGKRLEGEAALSSLGVGKGSTIEVKMRGRGGTTRISGMPMAGNAATGAGGSDGNDDGRGGGGNGGGTNNSSSGGGGGNAVGEKENMEAKLKDLEEQLKLAEAETKTAREEPWEISPEDELTTIKA